MGFVIALDGMSATGKHTLGLALSEKYKLAYLDTGALYRAVAYYVLAGNKSPEDKEEVLEVVKKISLSELQSLQNNPVIRTNEVSQATSVVASIPEVRTALLEFQRNFATFPVLANSKKAQGALLDGRDIGTVICPDAPVKFFLVAREEIRALRRFKELQSTQKDVILEDVLKAMQERDRRDSSREVAPAKPAEDAFILDTSDLTPNEVFTTACEYIEKSGYFKSP